RKAADPDWSFVTRPKWILSHLFAFAMIVSFIVAMFWQLDRREQRIAQNEVITARGEAVPLTVRAAIQSGSPLEVDFRRVEDSGSWIDPDVVRIANRSQNGSAGEWVVGLFETDDGTEVLVNRGFVELNRSIEDPPDLFSGSAAVRGWMRMSREREGIAVADTGEGTVLPRLNVDAVAARLDRADLAPMWLQLEDPTGESFPTPVPLPDQTNGPHLSYAGQWAIFAILGTVVYVLLMRRIATTRRD
ncbi:MAG: SURF1 family protein, partial [Acidimicrobiia bacterium]|nr:SURF1 family protein [Acidimicrobiia bacterium]